MKYHLFADLIPGIYYMYNMAKDQYHIVRVVHNNKKEIIIHLMDNTKYVASEEMTKRCLYYGPFKVPSPPAKLLKRLTSELVIEEIIK